MDWQQLYNEKLKTADEAVKLVKNGDHVEYGHFVTVPYELDAALARRKDELEDVMVDVTTLTFVPEVFKADPLAEHFNYVDGSYSGLTRKLVQKSPTFYARPLLYHEVSFYYSRGYASRNIMFVAVAPMDKNGYFNFSTTCSTYMDLIRNKGGIGDDFKIVVEVNPNLPRVSGDNEIHVTEVDVIVEEQENHPIVAIPKVLGDEIDDKIADNIMTEMVDGACLQLGIGGFPNILGKKLCESDIKDLGCHSEMFVDAYMDLFNCGKLTNRKKSVMKDKSVFTFAMGSKELYEFMDNNLSLRAMPVGFTNDPTVIAQNDKVYSICSCLAVDLFGNVSSESVGYKQISGTGGQLDYHFASLKSEGGKGFVCMPSSKVDKNGVRHSNIVTAFEQGTQITVPANMTNYIVTEYGIAKMKGNCTWQRIEELVKIAHPDFKDEIIANAEKAGLWRRSNKR